jgi:hypothetical protein
VASSNYSGFSPAIRDLDNDGIPELFVEQEDWKLACIHAVRAGPAGLAGHSLHVDGGCASEQRVFVPTFIDLNRDGKLDVVYANGGGAGASQPAPLH